MNNPSARPSNPANESKLESGVRHGDSTNACGDAEIDAPSDTELVEKSQAGDLDAFDRLVIRHRGRIYSIIMNMIHNDADSWDLTQDVFVKAWRALPDFAGRANFFTWLYRIAHNATYDWLRKRSNRVDKTEFDESIDGGGIDSSAPTAPSHAPAPDTSAEHGELRQRIDHAIQQLSADHREVILLKEVEGLSYQEISDAVGCSLGTVMSRLHYARKKLQQFLDDLQP